MWLLVKYWIYVGNIYKKIPLFIKYWLFTRNKCNEIPILQKYRCYVRNTCNEMPVVALPVLYWQFSILNLAKAQIFSQNVDKNKIQPQLIRYWFDTSGRSIHLTP